MAKGQYTGSSNPIMEEKVIRQGRSKPIEEEKAIKVREVQPKRGGEKTH